MKNSILQESLMSWNQSPEGRFVQRCKEIIFFYLVNRKEKGWDIESLENMRSQIINRWRNTLIAEPRDLWELAVEQVEDYLKHGGNYKKGLNEIKGMSPHFEEHNTIIDTDSIYCTTCY